MLKLLPENAQMERPRAQEPSRPMRLDGTRFRFSFFLDEPIKIKMILPTINDTSNHLRKKHSPRRRGIFSVNGGSIYISSAFSLELQRRRSSRTLRTTSLAFPSRFPVGLIIIVEKVLVACHQQTTLNPPLCR